MLEKDFIQSRGFRNIVKDGEIVGFQVPVRQIGYRGTYLSQLRLLGVSVDGIDYGDEQIRIEINGIEYTPDSLKEHGRIMWPLEQPAILNVYNGVGLEQGEREVSVFMHMIKSYMPPRFDTMYSLDKTDDNTRKMLIV